MQPILIVLWSIISIFKLGVQRMSKQICFHLLQTLPKQQQQDMVKRLQELNQPSKIQTLQWDQLRWHKLHQPLSRR